MFGAPPGRDVARLQAIAAIKETGPGDTRFATFRTYGDTGPPCENL